MCSGACPTGAVGFLLGNETDRFSNKTSSFTRISLPPAYTDQNGQGSGTLSHTEAMLPVVMCGVRMGTGPKPKSGARIGPNDNVDLMTVMTVMTVSL